MKYKIFLAAFVAAIMAFATRTTYARSTNWTSIHVYCMPDTLPSNDTLIAQLSTLDLAHYIGLPVDSLLDRLPSGVIEQRVASYNRPDLAEVLFVEYNSDVSVMIFVHGFVFMNPHIVNTSTPAQNWQVSLFRKERMAYAIVFTGGTCINGCEHQRQ